MIDASAYPMSGVKVVELAHVASGPFTGLLFADMGADVVKVEPPKGETFRNWPPFVGVGEDRMSTQFAALNRNKKSISADLKNPADVEMVRKLCREADIVLENFRPGVAERLGLGYEALAKDHRGLIYCSISGFGQTGPYRDKGAFDIIIQAMSGAMSVTGERGGSPVKCGLPIGDFVSGLYAAFAIAALLPEARAGKSAFVDVPMLDCLIAISPLRTSEYFGTGKIPGLMGNEHPTNVPYQSFASADGHFVVAAGTDKLFRHICDVVEQPQWATDPRFYDQDHRVQYRELLTDMFQAEFVKRPKAEWLERFEAASIPCGSINNFEEILADPHVTEGGLLMDVEIPGGSVPTASFPCRISGLPPLYRNGPPLVDADREAILRDWGVALEA